ncbi:iron-regulated protein [Fulvitalea axinellae]|uniref:Iron-regulated protein n=1 Tax=Fulvitalea axinellae TaxID=1182444 RepID=A0AAU9CSF5_9BACT|nr:iron-regulated protein [Fulvitalea axinellae]
MEGIREKKTVRKPANKKRNGLRKRLYNWSKKWHKYLGLFLAGFIIYTGFSGILLNHPSEIAGWSVHKSWVPERYHPYNWNRSALIKAVYNPKNESSLLVAGKQGVWRSDDGGFTFRPDMAGAFPESRYLRKTNDLLIHNQTAFAGTFGGLFSKKLSETDWKEIPLGDKKEDVKAVLETPNGLIAISKNGAFRKKASGEFEQVILPRPDKNSMSLIDFTFALHSGWLWGLPGRIVFDIVGLATVFLSVSAIYIFIFRKKKKNKATKKRMAFFVKYHNSIGFWLCGFILITSITGAFMRPPLLAALANGKAPSILLPSYFEENPWYHTIRNACYDTETDRIIIDTSEGLWAGKSDLKSDFTPLDWSVNIFPMGCTVLRPEGDGHFLVGSFYGLYNYKEGDDYATDALTGEKVKPYAGIQRPGRFITTGYFQTTGGTRYVSTHGQGLLPIDRPQNMNAFMMPKTMAGDYRMPLWNYMFELHNARLLNDIFGKWTILVIPLAGIILTLISLTGIFEYCYRKYRFFRK